MFSRLRTIPVLGLTGLLMAAVLLSSVVTPPVARAAPPDEHKEPGQTPHSEVLQVLFEEMTLVQLLAEKTGYAWTRCVGNGLNNVEPLSFGSMVLIPNAGDLAVDGSNVSIKLSPDGKITFIPRTQNQRIRVPMAVGDKVEGQETLSLSLAEAKQLMAAGHLVWTARDRGPYGTGHGLPGHIAACDPWFDEALYLDWQADQEES